MLRLEAPPTHTTWCHSHPLPLSLSALFSLKSGSAAEEQAAASGMQRGGRPWQMGDAEHDALAEAGQLPSGNPSISVSRSLFG
jgi:hypothetical protein